MQVKILGPGCAKCQRLYREAEMAVAASGLDVDLEKVADVDAILDYGVMMTPAIVIDGQVRASGRVPSADEITRWLTGAPSA